MPGHLFGRSTKGQLPTVVAGDGPWLIDSAGKRYFDACGGAAVSCLGHSNRHVLEAVKRQVDAIAFAHTGFFTSEPAEQLADRLCAIAPDPLDRAYLVSGGSEAVEAAVKMARQYFLEIGQPKRTRIVARWQSYHGNTLGALSAGGNRWRRVQFEPLLPTAMSHIDPCHYWRWAEPNESEEQYLQRVANQLAAEIERLGAENVAAFIAEPVVGATMGAVPAVNGYFRRIREICDQYGVLLILDEVMCGAGRTGTYYAFEQEGVTPDIVCVAKGLGAGIQPIGAAICTSDIYEAFEQGSGFFQHGHTYMGHPTAAAAANAVLDEVVDGGLLDNVHTTGIYLQSLLRDRLNEHAHVGNVRGRGLFIGIELVSDRTSKQPFAPSLALAAKIKKAGMARGLMCYPFGGTVDGQNGDHVLLAPPYIIERKDAEFVAETVHLAIDDALSESGVQ